MKEFISNLLDWIYKKKCYFCGDSKESLRMCTACYEEMMFSDYRVRRVIAGESVYVAGVYSKEMQKLIRGIKYHNQKELAFYLAKFMYEYFSGLDISVKFQVVPVPLHSNRQKKRGYNQMELVGGEFCKLTGYELNTEMFTRVKDTEAQYKLSYQGRMNNLTEAFCVNSDKILPLPILIIDDICTTGATFESMLRVLRESGYKGKIVCFAASEPQ